MLVPALVIGTMVFSAPRYVSAAAFAACDPRGFLFEQEGVQPPAVYSVDLVTGQEELVGNPPVDFNGVGYNELDDFIYGFDRVTNELVRIHSDFTSEQVVLTPSLPANAELIIGDIDNNGHYWAASPNHSLWFQIDLVPGSPTYAEILDQGAFTANIGGTTAGADWGFILSTGLFYRVTSGGGTSHLVSFDPATGTQTLVGGTLLASTITGMPATTVGAVYVDDQGFLYASNNANGNIYRIDIVTLEGSLIATGSPSNANDGARCASASVPIDFGDAPDAYGTLLASDGPRHSVFDYNPTSDTGSLMLGEFIDTEIDGFDTLNSNGDNLDNINDEEGLASIPTLTTLMTSYDVFAEVVNATGQDAILAGWVDFNGNQIFDANERATVTVPTGNPIVHLTWTGITPVLGDSVIRLRLFSDEADPQPTGSAAGGEVEDYALTIEEGQLLVNKVANTNSIQPGGVITYTVTIDNLDSIDYPNVTLTDDFTNVLLNATYNNDAQANLGVVSYSAPELTWEGDVGDDEIITITYSVTVNSNITTDTTMENSVLISAAVESNCPAASADPGCLAAVGITAPVLSDTGEPFIKFLLVGLGFAVAGIIISSGSLNLVFKKILFARKKSYI